MATNQNPSPHASSTNNATNDRPLLLPEIGADGLPRESPVIAYTEKIIEEEQLQLKKYIEENYSKIRDVEREFGSLTMEMKLTAGPKKAALEHMRKKIEMSTERLQVAKLKEEQARKAWEAASKAVKVEDAIKQKLCEDLNNLVTESSNAQLSRLEELKRRLEALNPGRSSTYVPSDKNLIAPDHSQAVHSLSGSTGNPPSRATTGDVPETNITSQPPLEAEGREKKKSMVHGRGRGRGRGIGAVPKGRGSAAPGWTGAGFDVDFRS